MVVLRRKISFVRQVTCKVTPVWLESVPEKLKVNQDYRFKLKVRDTGGNQVDLETIMGAKAHMVAFDAEQRGFAHMHPIEDILVEASETDDLSFYLTCLVKVGIVYLLKFRKMESPFMHALISSQQVSKDNLSGVNPIN